MVGVSPQEKKGSVHSGSRPPGETILGKATKMCNRVYERMECPECGYPYSEAMYPLDESIRHDIFCCHVHGYEFLIRTKTHVRCTECDFEIKFVVAAPPVQ